MNITTLGIDLAKNTFQLHGVDIRGNAILKKKISRSKLLSFVTNLPHCKVLMEACGASNYWGREFIKLGHEVKLMSPQYVKPFVKRNKNDAEDAEAIVEAGSRPSMRYVEIKSVWQQDIQSTHRMRERLIESRTRLSNQIRSLLMENGIFIAQGISKLKKELVKIIGNEEYELSGEMRKNVTEAYDELGELEGRIKRYDKRIEEIFKKNEACQRLEEIPGVGKLAATMLVAILGKGEAFKNGRHFAAFTGLVPRQSSSGGKERLLGISKRGDGYLRKLLIHGGRSVLNRVTKKEDRESVWLQKLARRAGFNRAAVAWANKIARKAWAIIYYGDKYKVGHVPVRYMKKVA